MSRRYRRPESRSLRGRPLIRRRITATGHITGLVLVVGGAGMAVSAGVDALDGGPDTFRLLGSGLLVGVPGLVLWRFTRAPKRMPMASVFAAVATAWVVLSVAATLPYLATGTIRRFDNAMFEAVAGFTTTGATVLRPIEGLGKGILFWRSMTQWFGGMGVIVLAVAVLPFLGVGGLGLLRAEAPGPSSERLVPRVRETARRLWVLYAGFSLAVALAYFAFGMSPYDAVSHMFTTVSTGGFSPYDASFGQFDSAPLEWVAVAAMFLAGGNFAIYWRLLRGQDLAGIWRSAELKAYVLIVGGISAAAMAWNAGSEGLTHDIVRGSIFSVVSISSTTGFATVDFAGWAPPVQLLLVFAMGLGGMTGSTSGGLKVFRLLCILGYARRQALVQLHPRLVSVVRLGREVVPEGIVSRVIGFFGIYMAVGGAATFVVAALGSDVITSISAAAASLGNVGPGLGEVGPTGHFLSIPAAGRAVLAFTMLVGRLEVFPVLLGFLGIARFLGRWARGLDPRRLRRRAL